MLKYIRYEGDDVVLFGANIQYDAMHAMQGAGRKPVSAGRMVLEVNCCDEAEVITEGGSTALNLRRLPDDHKVILKLLEERE